MSMLDVDLQLPAAYVLLLLWVDFDIVDFADGMWTCAFLSDLEEINYKIR
jgi:hypothetical protein